MTAPREQIEDFDRALDAVERAEHEDEMSAMWARLDVLEEMVAFLYDRLDIEYVGETEEDV
jgi:hypothetical protein